jgi:hypothetical protein
MLQFFRKSKPKTIFIFSYNCELTTKLRYKMMNDVLQFQAQTFILAEEVMHIFFSLLISVNDDEHSHQYSK